MSELPEPPDRIPDPPEGWVWADTSKPIDARAMFWHRSKQFWCDLFIDHCYTEGEAYIVPVDPPATPEPQYRPFKDAAEFDGWAFNFWRYKDDLRSLRRPPMSYSDDGHYGDSWGVSLARKEFADGSPFGVAVEP
jgi:hypothetical protein